MIYCTKCFSYIIYPTNFYGGVRHIDEICVFRCQKCRHYFTNSYPKSLHRNQGSSWRETWEVNLPNLSHSSLFQAQGEVVLHRVYRKNIPKDYHFSSKLQKTVKTSPCFKFVGLPQEIRNDLKWKICLLQIPVQGLNNNKWGGNGTRRCTDKLALFILACILDRSNKETIQEKLILLHFINWDSILHVTKDLIIMIWLYKLIVHRGSLS